MVKVTTVLSRIPVIKFRKGGAGKSGAAKPASGSTLGSCPARVGGSTASQSAAPMSTSTLADIDLPARYRRAPLSEEEIAHINGGGIA